ncbi:MAG: hypothetical protein ABSF59_01185 [Candidatus Sulfotelmatobacter sp.]|jgi:hypothetical protein
MTNKSKGMGLGIALGAALGVALGVMAGHAAIWIGTGLGMGMAIGSTVRLRQKTCPKCEAAKRNQEIEAESCSQKGVHHGITRARFHISPGQP